MRTNTNTPTLWNDNTSTSPLKISNWIDEVFEDALNWPRTSSSTFVPELNVYETDKEFEVSAALPGMNKDDIEISFNAGMLTISGERKMEQEENGRRYHRIESRFGKFNRSLPLPSDVIDQEKISAKYENGVLNVTIPKVKEKAAKKIKVT
ncbi:MAG: Hsp20/alpha crystallin family protein [Gracilimonas sp.]|uniref:Hsp20/alpha crystallin family protein n=1 Tax=Gracilimonas sp. TaxID=1974203 RepID=UPI0019A12691|nr:Hsp20/alpha crystallin family protein [Gracilimonas sp.]MBD3616354.1 Hsp20/alpha crystallin family protein [Gracilimonas sp.]